MNFLSEHGGTLIVAAILLSVIAWAVKQLREKKVQCMSCPIHGRCHKSNCNK